MDYLPYIGLLKREAIVAMGCTEPAAAALAGAKAAMLLDSPCERLVVHASRDMVKNAMGVGLPHCNLKGIAAAAALGAAKADPSEGLSILSTLTEEHVETAERLAANGTITLHLERNVPPVYVAVEAFSGNEQAMAAIAVRHDRFIKVQHNGAILLDEPMDTEDHPRPLHDEEIPSADLAGLTLTAISDIARNTPPELLEFLADQAQTNMAVARHAMDHDYGLAVGRLVCPEWMAPPRTLSEAYDQAAAYAAAASDARMAGCAMPVVINSGSGNQGITVSVPLVVMAGFWQASRHTLIQALCISNLVALTLTTRKDRLSALCGAFTAAIGTSCGMVHLAGGTVAHMDRAVNTMVANLTGIICDGAKATCALKIHSCVAAAALSCRLAMKDRSPSRESGIVGRDSLESIEHVSRLTHEGMQQTDNTILDIMLNKQSQGGC
jgi:L-cysteine desulfidase